MQTFTIETAAGAVSAELAKLGIGEEIRVRAVVSVAAADEVSMASVATQDRAFAWLADEPDLYSDDDVPNLALV